MPQFLVTCIFVLGTSGLLLFNWGLFAANSAYQELRRALSTPISQALTEQLLSELPSSIGGYLATSIVGAALSLLAFKLYRLWHMKYGAPAFPPTAA